MGNRRGIERLRGSFKMLGNALGLESRFGLADWRCHHSNGRFLLLLRCFHHRLRAPGEAVDPALAALLLPRFVLVKGLIDPAQGHFQRNARLAPGLDQRPVERGEQQQRAPSPLEVLFDFGEVIEVVVHEVRAGSPIATLA